MSKTFQRRDNKAGKMDGRERSRKDFGFDTDLERLQSSGRGVSRRPARAFKFFPADGATERDWLDDAHHG